MAQTLMVRVRAGKLNRHRKGEFSLFKVANQGLGRDVVEKKSVLQKTFFYQPRYLQLISIIGVQQCLKQIFK